jgi:mRNA-degrading endonuclease RelE of RelBE toxin-antitoxin system
MMPGPINPHELRSALSFRNHPKEISQRTQSPSGAKPFKQLKPPVFVYQFAAQYRVRVGDYRILYDVDDKQRIVWIFALRKRNERTYS